MEGVVPRPQADKTGHAVNRNTAGETTASRSTSVLRVEGVVPRPQADMTGHAVNRTTAGEATGSRSTSVLRVEGVESSLAINRIHCQSWKPLKHYNHHFTIRG